MNYYSSANQNKADIPEEYLAIKDEEQTEEVDAKVGKGFFLQDELRKQALDTIAKKMTINQQNKSSLSNQKPKPRNQARGFKTK